jgi:hypothetical protein
MAMATPEVWERRQAMFEFLEDPSRQLSALVDWASASPSQFEQLLDQLEQLTSELIRWTVSPESRDGGHPKSYRWINADGSASLAQHAQAVSRRMGGPGGAREFWIGRAERLARVRQESLAPLNRKILLQDLLLPWLNAV